MAHTS